MLQTDLFTFTNTEQHGNAVKTDVSLNVLHPIFQGHFPDRPILPGVCMIQMVKALVEENLQRRIQLVKAGEMKFLLFVQPVQDKLIELEVVLNVNDNVINADARLLDNATVMFKFKGTFALK